MSSKSGTDTYDAKTTNVQFSWPPGLTGVERMMLSAGGDLQRLLSAFFGRPIVVELVTSSTTSLAGCNPPMAYSATAANAIVQEREVKLLCENRTVCTATSSVRMTSPRSAMLFLEKKFAIGQVFRELGQMPVFELLAVGCGSIESQGTLSDKTSARCGHNLWRKYKLRIDGFECEITETFPDREMFDECEAWLVKG